MKKWVVVVVIGSSGCAAPSERGGEGEGEGETCRTIEGSVDIDSNAQLGQILDACEVTGAIRIRAATANSMFSVTLPTLQKAGAVSVGGQSIFSVSLPALRSVGEISVFTEPTVTLDLPLLKSARSIDFSGQSISAPLLESAQISIFSAAELVTLSFPSLTSGERGVSVADCPQLTGISMPQLASVDFVVALDNNSSLTEVSLPRLRSVEENFFIRRNERLRLVTLPSLLQIGNTLGISDNPALTEISLPALASGEVDIHGNEALVTCVGERIVTIGDCVQ